MKTMIVNIVLLLTWIGIGGVLLWGGWMVFAWGLSADWSGSTLALTNWIEFTLVFVLILVGLGLLSLQPVILGWWERRPSIQLRREAEDAEAERRAQAELRRVLLIEAERKARAQDHQIICMGIAQGILSALQEEAARLDALANSIHQQRIQRNLAHFCWCVARRIAPQFLADERGPEAPLEERAAQRRAEIEAFAASQQVTDACERC